MQWKIVETPDSLIVNELASQLNIDKALASILVQRGITHFDQSKDYFRPDWNLLHDPFLMLDLSKAANRLFDAIINKEMILVYGDYDVDGTTSVAAISIFLKHFSANFKYYIPDRYLEGYGLSYEGIEHAHEIGAKVLITLDCGIKSSDKAERISSYGIDWIICDHHQPDESDLPKAFAVLDPKRAQCPYPFKELTGCGVGFKLIQALTPRLNELFETHFDYKILADLLVLSIACDIVPVVGENRTMAYLGVQKIRLNPMNGVKSIMNQAKADKKWDITDLVFFIGPRINAAGRIKHAKFSVDVLISEDMIDLTNVLELESANTERKEIEKSIVEQSFNMLDTNEKEKSRASVVLNHKEWSKGVIGIVASKIVEKYYKPTILLAFSNGKWVGSGRSVHDFDLYEALCACSEHLSQFGGHKYAAGLALEEEKLDEFKIAFERYCSKHINDDQKEAILDIDLKLNFNQIDGKFIRILDQMEPFGPQNLRPRFCTENVELVDFKILGEKHAKMQFLKDGILLDAIWFSCEDKIPMLKFNSIYDIVYSPEFNFYNGNTTIQLTIKDIRNS